MPHRVVGLLALFLLAAPNLQARPLEYLPTGHPAYEDLEALAAYVPIDSLAIDMRPLARAGIAAALLRAERRDSTVSRNPLFRRLTRELAREVTELGGSPSAPESRRLVDTGPDDRRLRVSIAGHLRGDYDSKRSVAHFELRDESSLEARSTLQMGGGFALYDDIGITRIRSQRVFIDPIVNHTDLEIAVLRAGALARSGPVTVLAGYDELRWGPGRRGTLLLSDAAGPMTFLSLTGSFGPRVTASAVSGVLSRAEGKFLAAHRLEMILSKRFTVGVAEAVRYPSDSIDLLYAIGLLPYAVVERTHIRDASTDSTREAVRANVMASMDVVARVGRGVSAYGEVLLDDIATENRGMPDRFAFQLGGRLDRALGGRPFHGVAEYTRVRRFTYATYYGQDFIYRDRPLGFALGPDVESTWLEGRLDMSREWQIRSTAEFIRKGEGELGEAWDPSFGFVSTSGLLDVVERTMEFWGDLRWVPRDRLDVSLGLGHRQLTNKDHIIDADESNWLARLSLDARY